MPRMSTAELDAFLDEPGHLLRLATVDDDGFPRVVPIWFIRQGDDIVFTPRGPSAFLANIRRDPRVGLSIDEDPLPYRKVTVRGTARIVHELGDDDEWRDLYRSIAKRYVPDEAADAYVDATIDQPRALIAVSLVGDSRVSRRGGCRSATRTAPASGTGGTTSTAPTWPTSPTPGPAAKVSCRILEPARATRWRQRSCSPHTASLRSTGLSTLPPALRGRGSGRNVMNCGTLKSAMRCLGERPDLLRIGIGARTRDDDRADLLAHHLVGHAHHRHLEHRRVLDEGVLDLDAVDVLAAAVDHVLHAVDDLHEPLVVDAGEVAGVQPPIDERLGGLLGLVPVAGHHVLPADQQLPDARRRIDVAQVDLDGRRREARPSRVGPRRTRRAGTSTPTTSR